MYSSAATIRTYRVAEVKTSVLTHDWLTLRSGLFLSFCERSFDHTFALNLILKYYSSMMNIRDFFADNLGREFQGIISGDFDDNNFP